ncbi:MAG: bifunctional methylenetetrahydrofolate dehydrogenase/methenyltetrahydrofolate cyclohydrolase FolD [Bryobacteraceae bacterium]|nr:bifunctional methylenetetrahydrofolate dehydrogenase/methenyltetrahydrofolate cyclohydrolase FolD [Bryobacteraceae bacterium]
MATILSGAWVRDELLKECKPRVERLRQRARPPGLAVVLAGNDPASEIYVRNKVKACQELGIHSEKLTPPESVTTEELLRLVDALNRREEIDGILVQAPLPRQVDGSRVLLAVTPEKDVDGFHPLNLGRLMTGRPGPRACTPAGIMELLARYEIPIKGQRAVVLGRSDIVGKPMAMLLMHQHATVTICHSRTRNLEEEAARADILVAAMGRPALVTAGFIKPGATVIDVGMNRIASREEAARIFSSAPQKLAAFERNGSVLVGDVHPVDVVERAAAYTPVPGGVGPMTVAMLMVNTVEAAERRLGVCSG